MKYEIIKIHTGQITDEEESLTIFQICTRCRITPAEIYEMVNEGIIYPEHDNSKAWRFSYNALDRIRKAIRLRRELELNLAGAALSMHLLDKIEELESKLKRQNL